MDYQKIGLFLTNLRKQKGITQTKLAEVLNVTHQAISRWETGESIPDIQTLSNLSKFYKITIDEILNAELQKKVEPTPEVNVSELDNHSLVKFKNMNLISLLIVVVGLILFFTILWITSSALIGFAVQIILIIFGIIIFYISSNDFMYKTQQTNNKKLTEINMMYLKRSLIIGISLLLTTVSLIIQFVFFENYKYVVGINTNGNFQVAHYAKFTAGICLYIGLYNTVLALLITLCLTFRIDQFFFEKYGISILIPTNKTLKRINYLYFPFILIILIWGELINHVTIGLFIGMGLLILDDIYRVCTMKPYKLLRIGRILITICYIYLFQFKSSTNYYIGLLIDLSGYFLIFMSIMSIILLYVLYRKRVSCSLSSSIHIFSHITSLTLYFLLLVSLSLTVDWHSSYEVATQTETIYYIYKDNYISFSYILLFLFIDLMCRIIMIKTKECKFV